MHGALCVVSSEWAPHAQCLHTALSCKKLSSHTSLGHLSPQAVLIHMLGLDKPKVVDMEMSLIDALQFNLWVRRAGKGRAWTRGGQ